MQRIPGFNAAASLYTTSKHYWMVGTNLSTPADERKVQPQAGGPICAPLIDGCLWACGVEDESTGTSYTIGYIWNPDCKSV